MDEERYWIINKGFVVTAVFMLVAVGYILYEKNHQKGTK